MFPEGGLHLQLLLDGSISQLSAVALHLCRCTKGALQAPGLVLHFLKLTLQSVKLWLTLQRKISQMLLLLLVHVPCCSMLCCATATHEGIAAIQHWSRTKGLVSAGMQQPVPL